ncbi:MAG: ATP-dependent zinc protease [Gammaproteobacteria bacterium]|uniref:ATP-dependent zinc protease family protein n=1 Tax=Pseudomaricurvus alcaniphilus TaxID=1166482 RepID=UPI001408153F|nr:ATP-dependent zinc protease [Pseudomaricurvus alcaniphilus]MBR9909615.1 ATP-dependent zinc protease [Gammaproteobacteria bacterium]NHN36969.1 ATP-dependent zinc protease [Pseudomaricurvus alcaniphilus]
MTNKSPKKVIIGNLEVCNLPDIGIQDLQIRVDTGAKTSSLHVDNLVTFKKNGRPWVKFDIHPDVHHVESVIECESRLHDIRNVKSSNGESQERYVIRTTMQLGGDSWPIEITLTDRSDMSFLMLLGREGMGNRVLVDPSQTFLLTSDD